MNITDQNLEFLYNVKAIASTAGPDEAIMTLGENIAAALLLGVSKQELIDLRCDLPMARIVEIVEEVYSLDKPPARV